jgi:hypothetical protein
VALPHLPLAMQFLHGVADSGPRLQNQPHPVGISLAESMASQPVR